jgi:spore protease
MVSIRTDLAIEAAEFIQQTTPGNIPGVKMITEQAHEDIRISRVNIETREGERLMGKSMGQYITLEIPRLREKDPPLLESVSKILSREIKELVDINQDDTVLVVGLGNWNVTPDSLGPKVINHLFITRHLLQYIPDQIGDGVGSVAGLSPGVMGITGIETGEIIQGVIDRIKPKAVIAIDALASRRMDRVSTTIQMSNTGIHPGSGVGNKRMALSKDTLGIPVIALGIPLVVDAATMANDTIDLMIDSMLDKAPKDSGFYNLLKDMNKEEKHMLIREVLSPYVGNLMVTPKEIDTLVEDISKVIAGGLNIALHPGIDENEATKFLH